MNKRQYKKYKNKQCTGIQCENMIPIVLQEKIYNHIKNNLPDLISKMNYFNI